MNADPEGKSDAQVPFAVWLVVAAVAGYLISGWYQKPTDRQTYETRSTHMADLKDAKDIVFLGDSRIRDAEWSELLKMDISNRGIDSDTTKGVRDRLGTSVPSDTKVCVLQVGYNDLGAGMPAEDVASRLADIARAARAKRVIVTSVIPVSQNVALNGRIAELNKIAPEAVKRAGAEWLDLSPVFGDNLSSDLTSDGIHLNGTGYRRLVEPLAKAIGSP